MVPGPHVSRRDRDEQDVIRQAVNFILERTHLHEVAFTLEVGQYLFERVYGGSLRRYRSTRPGKDTTLRRIAASPRIDYSHNELYECVQTYLLNRRIERHRPRGVKPVLSSDKWKKLWKLYDDPDMLIRMSTWVERHRIPKVMITAAVQTLDAYIAAGGDPDDLLVGDVGGEHTPLRRVLRMLDVLIRWVVEGPRLPARTRRDAVALIDRMLGDLDRR